MSDNIVLTLLFLCFSLLIIGFFFFRLFTSGPEGTDRSDEDRPEDAGRQDEAAERRRENGKADEE